jgi:ABC-type branched-subunit amino acid transport system substrate-binding protein
MGWYSKGIEGLQHPCGAASKTRIEYWRLIIVWRSKLSRRRFLALSGSALASALLGNTLGQTASGGSGSGAGKVLRIGAVIPTRTTLHTLRGFTEDAIGRPANFGAQMAVGELAPNVDRGLITSAMGADAVTRAAERLSSVEEVYAIIGGFSTEEVLALGKLAVQRDFIFLNIGAQSDALRGESCNSHTFHLAPSATMYLEAMIGWGIHSDFQRWFFVYSDEQKANYANAKKMLKSRGSNEVGSTAVPANEPIYTGVFEDIKKAEPDLVVLLLEPTEQLTFSGQYETSGLSAATIGYPAPSAQTRKFYSSSLRNAPKTAVKHRHIASWEATLSDNGAQRLNLRFLGRFGQAMDPSAWAAYMGIKILAEAATKTGSTKSTDLIKYMENPQTTFDIDKGAGTSFRSWNHQMRQPLYLVKTNKDYQDKTTLQDLAVLEGELPALYEPDVPPVKRLEQLGVSEQDSRCKLEAVGE